MKKRVIEHLINMIMNEENFNTIEDIVLAWNFHHGDDEIFLGTRLVRCGESYNAIIIEDDEIYVDDDYAECVSEW